MTGRDEAGRISRRALLTSAAGVVAGVAGAGVLVEQDVLPGRSRVYRALGLNGDGAPFPEELPPGELLTGSFTSRHSGGAPTPWVIARPRGVALEGLPVLVALHGGSGDHTTPFDTMALDRYLGAAVEGGLPPFAIASVNGRVSYWRPRPDGTDGGRMVTEELLPLLEERGLDTGRLALYGWSLGGYGALRLAGMGRLTPRAVAVSSPALQELDLAEDPDSLDVVGHPERLAEVAVRIDCGRGDPFYPVVHDFVDELSPPPEGSFGAGGHTPEYWRTVAPEQIEFVGRRLALVS